VIGITDLANQEYKEKVGTSEGPVTLDNRHKKDPKLLQKLDVLTGAMHQAPGKKGKIKTRVGSLDDLLTTRKSNISKISWVELKCQRKEELFWMSSQKSCISTIGTLPR
jgi:hypothetical protein